MTDDMHDERLRMEARDYNPPGAPRRDLIWDRIQEARMARRAPARRPRWGWVWPGVGIAAVLMLGIAIGRISMHPGVARNAHQVVAAQNRTAGRTDEVQTNAPATNPPVLLHAGERPTRGQGQTPTDREPRDGSTLVYRLAVVQHLAGTEALLTAFGAAARDGNVDAQITTWARSLLNTTRLLQSTAAVGDPTMRRLLDDLELVLVQIAQYSTKGSHRAEELEFIRQSIDKRGVIAKLRTTIPAGMSPAGT